MNWQNIKQLVKPDYLLLIPILVLAFYMAFIPHLDYLYPVHIDEWVHMAYSNGMMTEGQINFPEPFKGGAIAFEYKLELGFQLFWGVFQRISGISWPDIFRYFPSVIFMITVLSVFVMARKEGFGWEAALFTCLIPTNVGIMGPALLIPVSMALLFVPLALFIAFNFRSIGSYLVLFIFNLFLISIHSPSAICVVLILVPYILLSLKGDFKRAFGLFLSLIAPFIVTLPWTYGLIVSYGQGLFTEQLPSVGRVLPIIMQDYGYLLILSCLLGTFWLSIKAGKKNYGLVLGLMIILVMLATFYTTHYGILILYLRGLLFGMLMAGIVAGAGLMAVRRITLPETITARLKTPFIKQGFGIVLCVVLLGFTLATTIPSRYNTPFYHMIDEVDYNSFVWIKENVTEDYQKAILDPWKATAFTAITGKRVHTRIHFSPQAKDREADVFLANGCVDTAFMKENGISIIYNRQPCSNPDLVELRKNIYLLK